MTWTPGARISGDNLYRYLLTRHVEGADPEGGAILWVMLNPSTATEHEDDPTVRKVRGFTERWGGAAFHIVNLWPYRTSSPDALVKVGARVAAGNEAESLLALGDAVTDCRLVVAAWGANYERCRKALGPAGITPRILRSYARRTNTPMACLGLNADGTPRHPLMLAYDTPRLSWPNPKESTP